MIVDRIIAYLEAEGKTVDEAVLDLAAARMRSAIKRQLMQDRADKPFHLSPHNVGKCPRQLSFLCHGHKRKPLNARTRLTFWYGDIVETGVLVLAKLAGCDIDWTDTEVKTPVGRGFVDARLRDEGLYVVEVKSMSDIGFREFENLRLPVSDMWGYVTQCQTYSQAISAVATVMVGVRKSTGHLAERLVKRDDYRVTDIISQAKEASQRDPANVTRPDWAAAKLHYMPRKKCYEIKDARCRYCDCIEACWPGVKIETLKKGPVFRVPEEKLGGPPNKEPKPKPEISQEATAVDLWGCTPKPRKAALPPVSMGGEKT